MGLSAQPLRHVELLSLKRTTFLDTLTITCTNSRPSEITYSLSVHSNKWLSKIGFARDTPVSLFSLCSYPSETSRSCARIAYCFQYHRGAFVPTPELHPDSTALQLSISAFLVAQFNRHHNYFSTDERDRTAFLLFASTWTIVLSALYMFFFFTLPDSVMNSVGSHIVL